METICEMAPSNLGLTNVPMRSRLKPTHWSKARAKPLRLTHVDIDQILSAQYRFIVFSPSAVLLIQFCFFAPLARRVLPA
ncbi:hypothetical protein Arad_7371 [Rhizobium rhizogenes K84]|uniref:Uncharacterized protein n=1 Tax=Rhizobium rhizogenes (strain K84 / ATCC BAA-868) TaxID=311403 RepID=B9JMV9_RHIR8|nr:hypothetical protein Arad_7371 [Rhizobium rhizogenes K84]